FREPVSAADDRAVRRRFPTVFGVGLASAVAASWAETPSLRRSFSEGGDSADLVANSEARKKPDFRTARRLGVRMSRRCPIAPRAQVGAMRRHDPITVAEQRSVPGFALV